jgi:hypothetical protein
MAGPNHPNGVMTSHPAAGKASVRNLIEEVPGMAAGQLSREDSDVDRQAKGSCASQYRNCS